MLNQWWSQCWFRCRFPPFNFIPWSSPPTQHTLPSAHLHDTTTGPSGSFPQKRHTEVKIAASTVCSPANLNFCLWWKTHLRPSVSPDSPHQASARLLLNTAVAALNICSSCYILKEKTNNLRVFLCDIRTLSLLVASFRPSRLHRSPDEQTSGGNTPRKRTSACSEPRWSSWGWFGESLWPQTWDDFDDLILWSVAGVDEIRPFCLSSRSAASPVDPQQIWWKQRFTLAN